MDTAGYFRTLRRHFVLVITSALVGLALAAGVGQAITPTYRAQATLFLKVQAASTSLFERSQFALQRVQSYPQLLESPSLLQTVIQDLSLDTTPQQLAKRISATNPTSTVLVNVTADASTPRQAAAIANAAAEELARNVNTLENSETTSKNAVLLSLQIRAQPPQSPSSPNVPVILGLGVLAGLVFGFLLALLLEAVRPTMRTPADVRRVTGLPLVAQFSWSQLRPPAKLHAKRAAEAVAANLTTLGRGTVPPVLLLAPVSRGAAKPLVRFLVALGLAETGRSVVVVETDVAAGLPKGLSTPPNAPGLSELLGQRTDPASAIIPHAFERVDLVPAGNAASAPSRFEIERQVEDVLAPIVRAHDAAVLQATDGGTPLGLASVAPVARAALLVVSARTTSERAARRMVRKLRALGATPIGVLMVAAPPLLSTDLVETWHDGDFFTVTPAAEPVATAGRGSRLEALSAAAPSSGKADGDRPRLSDPALVSAGPSSDDGPTREEG